MSNLEGLAWFYLALAVIGVTLYGIFRKFDGGKK